jgi:hypothetical protein
MPKDYHQTVEAMRPGNKGPTAPLSDFIKAYNEDDNWWWRIECGHHQNLFEAALDWCDAIRDEYRKALAGSVEVQTALLKRLEEVKQQVAGNFDREMRESAAD